MNFKSSRDNPMNIVELENKQRELKYCDNNIVQMYDLLRRYNPNIKYTQV